MIQKKTEKNEGAGGGAAHVWIGCIPISPVAYPVFCLGGVHSVDHNLKLKIFLNSLIVRIIPYQYQLQNKNIQVLFENDSEATHDSEV